MIQASRTMLPLALAAVWTMAGVGQQSPAPGAQTPPTAQGRPAQDPQQPAPVFRTGINLVRVDVIVTDGRGNAVTNLTQADFDVLEDGQRQAVDSFKLVEVAATPSPDAEPPRPIRTEDDLETEAARPDVRLFAIMLDDYHVRRASSMVVRAPLIRFIQTQLAPLDMVALMYPLTPLDDVKFSRNREALVSAIDRFEGRKYNYEPRNELEERYAFYPAATVEMIRNQVSMSALKGLVTYLGGLREGRKAVVLVSEGYSNNLPPQLNDPNASLPGLNNPARRMPGVDVDDPRADTARFFNNVDIMNDLRAIYDAANRANTAIYSLDPRGLAPFEYDINEGVGSKTDQNQLRETQDTLRTLADETDGRAIVNSNDLDSGLRQIVKDSSVYYLLGYYSTQAPTDGKFHRIEVKVKRPGVQVRSRKGYWAYTSTDAARATAPPKPGPPPEVETARATLAEVADPPRGRVARSWIGMARGEGGRTRIQFVWEPIPQRSGEARDPANEPARVWLIASGQGTEPVFRGAVQQTAVPEPPGPTPAVAAGRRGASVVFAAEPGALQLRVTVENANGRLIDSDRRELVVPDFTGTDVMLSTPRLLRAYTARELQAIRADPNAVPAVAREFSRRERILVRVEAYGPGETTPAVTAKLLNRQAQPMLDLTVEPPPAAGGAFQAEVPIASLPPGEYFVEVSASASPGSTRQLIGIRVTG
jgi:VWFA-related protein